MIDSESLGNKKRRVVRVHSQAMEMFEEVNSHLKENPKSAILFMLDYEQALGELGFSFSKGMRTHLANVLPPTDPYKKECFRRIKNGETPPVDIELTFGSSATKLINLQSSVATLSTQEDQFIESSDQPDEASLEELESLSNFSVLIQLSEDLVNRCINAGYQSSLFPNRFSARHAVPVRDLAINIDCLVEIGFSCPIIDFDTGVPNGIKLSTSINVHVVTEIDILQYFSPTHSEFRQQIPIDFHADLEMISAVSVVPIGGNESSLFADLKSIIALEVSINEGNFSTELLTFLNLLVQRVWKTEWARRDGIPLSFTFDHSNRSGIPIRGVHGIVKESSGAKPGCLCIGLDTFGDADPNLIVNLIPPNNHFAFVTTRRFLLGQVWPTLGLTQFPRMESGVKLYNPILDLRNGHLFFQLEAEKEIDCLPDVNATGRIRFRFAVEPDPINPNIWRARLAPLGDPDIDVDFWDQVFYGFVVFLIGAILGGVIGAPVVLGNVFALIYIIVLRILEGVGEREIGDRVRGFSVGFEGKIPGSSIKVSASTRIEPEIFSSHIFGYGDAIFH